MEFLGFLLEKNVGKMGKKYALKFRLLCLFFLGILLALSLFVSLNTVKALDEKDINDLTNQEEDNQNISNLEIENRYLGNALTVYSKENFLYVFEENNVLRVYDIKKPGFPEIINSITLVTEYYQYIRIEDDILYLPNQNPTLLSVTDNYYNYFVFDSFVDIYNLTDPYNIYKIGEFFVHGNIASIFVENYLIYINHYTGYDNQTEEYYSDFYIILTNLTLTVYNATNPENVAIIKGQELFSTYGRLVYVEGNIVFFNNYSGSNLYTLYLVNFTDIYEPKFLGSIALEHIIEVSAFGNILFVQYYTGEFNDYESFINLYSIENPANPILLSTTNIEERYTSIQVHKNILFYVSNKMLTLYDISSPVNPEYLYEISLDVFIRNFFISDEYIITVNSDRSITIFYFSTSNPKFLRNYQRVFIYIGISLIFIVIPLVHFLYERLSKKGIIKSELIVIPELMNTEEPDKEEKKELFILQPAKYPFKILRAGFAIFAIQNAFMILFAFIIFFALLDSFAEQYWLNYLFNILFFMDLIFALVFVVALVLLYLIYKQSMFLVIALFWLAWICATFTYRFFMGLPEYYPQIGFEADYSSYLSISGLFATNVILLWISFFLLSEYLKKSGMELSQGVTFYCYLNYFLGFFMSIGFIFGNEFRYSIGWGVAFFIALFFKAIILPMFGIGIGANSASRIRNILYNKKDKSRI